MSAILPGLSFIPGVLYPECQSHFSYAVIRVSVKVVTARGSLVKLFSGSFRIFEDRQRSAKILKDKDLQTIP